MTIEQEITKLLEANGLFPNQAKEVLAMAVIDDTCRPLLGRWQDDISRYPAFMSGLVWRSVKPVALAYIDKNCPQAWFRPMFADSQEGK